MAFAARRSAGVGLTIAVFAIAASTNCSRASAASGTAGDTLFVGVAVGLQSPERYVNVFNGVQLALDELNASRPSGARPLGMRRPPSNATAHVQVAAALRDDPSVIGVVGHTESDPTISAAAVYDDHEHDGKHAIVAVSPTAGAGAVTQASDWVFRVCPVVNQQATTLAKYMTDSLHLSRIAIVYRNDVSGREFLRTFASTIEAAHATLIERDPFAEEISEFDLYAQRLARSRPDGLMVFANSSDVLRVLHAVHAAGLHPTTLSTNGPSQQEIATDDASGHDFQGLRYLALFLPDRPLTTTATRFVATFQTRFGQKPDHWGALSYDAAMLIGRAAQAVGPDRKRIRDWIAGVGTERPAYAGATGEIRFGKERNPIDKPALVTGLGR
jgi:branched-chain amino acid transport system substrate-binding protein